MNTNFAQLVANVNSNGGKLPNFTYNGKVRVAVRVDRVLSPTAFIGKQEDGSFRHFKLTKIS